MHEPSAPTFLLFITSSLRILGIIVTRIIVAEKPPSGMKPHSHPFAFTVQRSTALIAFTFRALALALTRHCTTATTAGSGATQEH